MINDLLSLSRMDSGTAKLNLEYVNINELFNYILNRFDMIIKNEAADPSQKEVHDCPLLHQKGPVG